MIFCCSQLMEENLTHNCFISKPAPLLMVFPGSATVIQNLFQKRKAIAAAAIAEERNVPLVIRNSCTPGVTNYRQQRGYFQFFSVITLTFQFLQSLQIFSIFPLFSILTLAFDSADGQTAGRTLPSALSPCLLSYSVNNKITSQCGQEFVILNQG